MREWDFLFGVLFRVGFGLGGSMRWGFGLLGGFWGLDGGWSVHFGFVEGGGGVSVGVGSEKGEMMKVMKCGGGE